MISPLEGSLTGSDPFVSTTEKRPSTRVAYAMIGATNFSQPAHSSGESLTLSMTRSDCSTINAGERSSRSCEFNRTRPSLTGMSRSVSVPTPSVSLQDKSPAPAVSP